MKNISPLSLSLNKPLTRHRGFTIIELGVVIVIIAILAVLSIVVYNGIQRQGYTASLQSDLVGAKKLLELDMTFQGSYPATHQQTDEGSGIPQSPGTEYIYTQTGGGTGFCLTGYSTKAQGLVFHVANGEANPDVMTGACSGHVVPGGSSNNSTAPLPPLPLTMQDITSSYCQNNMFVYTGSNPEAILTLQDNRGTTPQEYEVAKLADNRCWMIENLRLGSTSGTTALTPANTNIASNWTLPQVLSSGATSYDQPRIYGPVPGDAGGSPGANNYGFLYNWCAATAGGTASGGSNTCTVGTVLPANATGDVCAAGWRLPTGGSGGELSGLDIAFGGTGQSNTNNPSHHGQWLDAGPFKGVFSGSFSSIGFDAQNTNYYIRSSSADPSTTTHSLNTNIGLPGVIPGVYSNFRGFGFNIRCILSL
jgi:type IV pilus assembly protein PilA